MAQPTAAIATKSKDHRRRKNPRSADIFAAERKARNAKRPKQRWVGGESVSEGGYWTREAV
jgi:hypothetical protein